MALPTKKFFRSMVPDQMFGLDASAITSTLPRAINTVPTMARPLLKSVRELDI